MHVSTQGFTQGTMGVSMHFFLHCFLQHFCLFSGARPAQPFPTATSSSSSSSASSSSPPSSSDGLMHDLMHDFFVVDSLHCFLQHFFFFFFGATPAQPPMSGLRQSSIQVIVHGDGNTRCTMLSGSASS